MTAFSLSSFYMWRGDKKRRRGAFTVVTTLPPRNINPTQTGVCHVFLFPFFTYAVLVVLHYIPPYSVVHCLFAEKHLDGFLRMYVCTCMYTSPSKEPNTYLRPWGGGGGSIPSKKSKQKKKNPANFLLGPARKGENTTILCTPLPPVIHPRGTSNTKTPTRKS